MTTVGNWYAQNGTDLAAKGGFVAAFGIGASLRLDAVASLGRRGGAAGNGRAQRKISGLLPPQRRDSGRRRPHRALDAVNLSVKSS